MNSYPMTRYVPSKPKVDVCYDLHNKLKKLDFDEIVNDPTTHFRNVYVTNFDLIHHSVRGDALKKKSFIRQLPCLILSK